MGFCTAQWCLSFAVVWSDNLFSDFSNCDIAKNQVKENANKECQLIRYDDTFLS